MKRAYVKSVSYSKTLNGAQYEILKNNKVGYLKNDLRILIFVIALGVVALFSNQIQNTLISEYNKSVAFMQKHNVASYLPLGV